MGACRQGAVWPFPAILVFFLETSRKLPGNPCSWLCGCCNSVIWHTVSLSTIGPNKIQPMVVEWLHVLDFAPVSATGYQQRYSTCPCKNSKQLWLYPPMCGPWGVPGHVGHPYRAPWGHGAQQIAHVYIPVFLF